MNGGAAVLLFLTGIAGCVDLGGCSPDPRHFVNVLATEEYDLATRPLESLDSAETPIHAAIEAVLAGDPIEQVSVTPAERDLIEDHLVAAFGQLQSSYGFTWDESDQVLVVSFGATQNDC